MPILHPWTNERPLDQIETLHTLLNMSSHYGIISEQMDDKEGYWKFLLKFWYNISWPLIIVEQDNVPTLDQIDELYECTYDSCCFPYQLTNTGIPWSLFWDGKPPFPKLVQGSSFGCTKIGPIVRSTIDLSNYPGTSKASDQPVERWWWGIDYWLCNEMKLNDLWWHVHDGEVKHNHR